MRTSRGKVLYFAALGSSQPVLEAFFRHVPERFPFANALFSFGEFHDKKKLERYRSFERVTTIGDSGAFTSRQSQPSLFVDKGARHLADFYNIGRFNHPVEPDAIPCGEGPRALELSKHLAFYRGEEFYRELNKRHRADVIRPLQGKTPDDVLAYKKAIDKRLGKFNRPEYYGLGGIDPRLKDTSTVKQIAISLADRGVRKFHIFSTTSEKALDLVVELSPFFEQISVDGSGWEKRATRGKAIQILTSDGQLENVSFRGAKKSDPSERQLKLLAACDCPYCLEHNFADEVREERALKAGFLGMKSRQVHQLNLDTSVGSVGYFQKLCSLKAQLHNVWQQLLYLETKLRSLETTAVK